jgi:RND family efflux transporter MFP subunit
MVPAGKEIVIAAPVSGRITTAAAVHPGDHVNAGQTLLRFLPLASVDRDVRARAERELAVAEAELELARTRVIRADAMVSDRSGSQRALEDARAQFAVAKSSQRAAEARLRTLDNGALDSDVSVLVQSPVSGVLRNVRVAAGQSVPSGAPLIEIAAEGRWVRATFPASDAALLGDLREVSARRLGAGETVSLSPTLGPPSADAVRGTVDRFFVLPETAATRDWVPGERILVEVVSGEARAGVQAVPFAAVVHDAAGSAWVYEAAAADSFVRRRVEPLRRDGERWLLARGPAVGSSIVATGAAELWGFELGADR